MMSLAFDANGAKTVYILGRREESLKKVAAKATNKTIVPIVCDVSDKDALEAAVKRIESETPFVNVVVANSGVTGPETSIKPFSRTGKPPVNVKEIQEHLWAATAKENNQPMDINVVGTYNTVIAFLGLLDAGNTHAESISKEKIIWSQFITVSSDVSFIREAMVDYPYSMSKAAISHLTKMLATEFAQYNIRANSVAPGLFPSEATVGVGFISGTDSTVYGGVPAKFTPMQRAGSIEDMAGIMLFLTSRAGAYLNGTIILNDGGYTATVPSSY
jgi:NAD(P)-dependent dehydrogenase (short-subunit alcohol dehydrogenase family)